MNKIFKIMNQDYMGLKPYKAEIRELNQFLKKEKIKIKINDEKTLFLSRWIKKSIELKNKIDSIYYFESSELKRMNFSLTFYEKNQILKDVIQQCLVEYDIVNVDNREIIFPIFSQKINEVYIYQPASLEAPIYQQFIVEYQNHLDFSLFDDLIYQSNAFDGFKKDEFIYFNEFRVLVFGGKYLYIENSNILDVIKAIKDNNQIKLIDLLLDGTNNDKKKKRLEKIRGKNHAFK